jgi:integrase
MRIRQGYLFKRGGTYYVAWRVNGKLFMRTTGETNKKKAEDKRAEIMQPFVTGDETSVLQNIASKIEGRKAEVAKIEEERNPAITFDRAWAAYMESPNRPDSGERTLSDYSGYFASFTHWMQKNHADKPALRDVTPAIAAGYAVHLGKIGLSSNSFNKHIRLLELIFRVTRDRTRPSVNPWEDINRKRVISVSRRELTIEELKTVCLVAKGEMRLLLALGIYTGLRLGDCATLRWGEVDIKRGIIRRVPSKTARRNPKPVLVPLHKTLRTMLEEIPVKNRRDYVLPESADLYLKSSSELSKRIHLHFEACGVKTQKPGTGRLIEKGPDGKERKVSTGKRAVVEVGFHSLRHTFVSMCREANAPLSVVEAIVGHANPAMTRHYTHTSEAAAGAAVALLPDVTGNTAEKPELPAADTMTILKSHIRELAEQLTPENTKTIRQQLLSLADT